MFEHCVFVRAVVADKRLRSERQLQRQQFAVSRPPLLIGWAPYVTTLSLVLTKPRYNARTKFSRALFDFLEIFQAIFS
jgi:hypothetical protein